MDIQIRPALESDFEEIRQFLLTLGYGSRVEDPFRFYRMLNNSTRKIIALESGVIVGFVRALSDNISNGLISMLAVSNENRKNGVGTQLIEHLIGEDPHITWILRIKEDSGLEKFYKNLGFQVSSITLEKDRSIGPLPKKLSKS